jgi:6-phosphogluconate dehydrogenase
MKVAIIGLGKMGMQMVAKLIADNHQVLVLDRDESKIEEAKSLGALPAASREEIVKGFGDDQIAIWLMIPAGAVDDELDSWHSILPSGSIIIDGGNSEFTDTKARHDKLQEKGIELVDVGTSGGILGSANGFSMMIGGSKEVFDKLTSVFETFAKPSAAFAYFGPSGSGHFIKMVHNAIEYGYMESLAEGYELLAQGPYKDIDLKEVSNIWQHRSIIESTLNGLVGDIFKENPSLEGISGEVEESGEARWTLDLAKSLDIKTPAIQSAFDVRIASQKGEISFATKLLAALRNKFGGHAINNQ